ncbi:hypothetical protein [Pseudomonas syringae group genomosp. 3]|uniref:hypothetical protein n=1 Tax=Pseudomonas syringae group genomosp. 3 TaxID=251701 RepID=UPI001068B18D|nr:hypothetical protein [Pseudomonas syringae group genomosp. 3]TES72057.1 hypothetical protein E2N89_30020 [Pseudomonas syringae pv. tomato]
MYHRDLRPTKAERSSAALRDAAQNAEFHRKWFSAAELYEAAASFCPPRALSLTQSEINRMLRKADQCRQLSEKEEGSVTVTGDETEFSTMSLADLAVWYTLNIGYDPVEETPTLTVEELRQTCTEYCEARAYAEKNPDW